MKQLKVFINSNRVDDLLQALGKAGFHCINLFDVKGVLRALGSRRAALIRSNSASHRQRAAIGTFLRG